MTGNGSFSKDPLDLARSQMDFARMAADAPSSKEILFKAQTIIPATPAKPVWQKGAPLAGAAVAAGLLFAPMLPEGSSLDRLSVNFEQSIPASRAQQLEFDIRNQLPGDILMGSEFSAQGSEGLGRLTLSFSAAGEPSLVNQVERVVKEQTEEFNRQNAEIQLSPLYGRVVNEASCSHRESVVQRVGSLFTGKQASVQYFDRDNHSASELLSHPELLMDGLNSALHSEGYRLSGARFLPADAGEATADARVLRLPCWPSQLEVTVDANDLADFERESISRVCSEWIDSVNLGQRGSGLASQPGELLPIVVQVISPDGMVDRLLSERAQAAVQQPDAGQVTDAANWDVREAVEPRIQELFGNRRLQFQYARRYDPGYNRDVNFFNVIVTLTEHFDRQEKIDKRVEDLEQEFDKPIGF